MAPQVHQIMGNLHLDRPSHSAKAPFCSRVKKQGVIFVHKLIKTRVKFGDIRSCVHVLRTAAQMTSQQARKDVLVP